MRLDTEFLQGAHKHRRQVPKHKLEDGESPIQQIEEIWDKEYNRDSHIGSGAFGHVWYERRRPLTFDPTQTSHTQSRAVKQILKAVNPNYIRELQAIATFSQDRYKSYFVQSYGWFEDRESIYITMEYLRLGDLADFRKDHGRFVEKTAGLIMRQVLEGIGYMHEINFAHRDLKPANILIVSTKPWRVKLADFGVSKQFHEAAQLETQTGTPAYQAPELREASRATLVAGMYSLSVDNWAIGVITMELVLDHPFLYASEQREYTDGRRSLGFDDVPGVTISELCQDFIKGLLAPDPQHRPTAKHAILHDWFATVEQILEHEDSIFLQDEVIVSQRRRDAVTSPRALAPWSPPPLGNLLITDHSQTSALSTRSSQSSRSFRSSRSSRSSHSTRSIGSRQSTQTTQSTQTESSAQDDETTTLETYQGRAFNSRLLVSAFQNLSLEKTKFFVMRSDNEPDMEICLADNRWIGLRKANVKVDNGYRRSGGNVVIFFGVSKKRRFCGVARMLSAVDWENTDEDWMPREDGEKYEGRFEVEWLTVNELHFDLIQHVPARLGKQRKAVQSMDGFELAPESGYELLRVYSEVIRQNPTRYNLI